jgi:bifunctional UDP-N-acetylglucosamine pyrophosphorylase / glucosamine-1-phosphate N-acetyltransferase
MIHVVLLAAGKGTRMKSDLPKVLTLVKGKPIILRLLESVTPVCEKPTLIVGHRADEVIAATGNKYNYVLQKEQLGTGHAIMAAKESLAGRDDIDTILVLPGDHPLVKTETLENLFSNHTRSGATVTVGTTIVSEFTGGQSVFNHFGRVMRDAHGNVDRIVEYKDATREERKTKEVNTSYYCFDAKWLWENIESIGSNNASKEFYLTDMISLAKSQGRQVDAFVFGNTECLGINTLDELKMVEEALDNA